MADLKNGHCIKVMHVVTFTCCPDVHSLTRDVACWNYALKMRRFDIPAVATPNCCTSHLLATSPGCQSVPGRLDVTVHTFHPCTSRQDVRHCLVVQTPMHNMSKEIDQAHQ